MIGAAEGSIIATIITNHTSRNIAADTIHEQQGIGDHIMDIVQPPGIAVPQDIVRQK